MSTWSSPGRLRSCTRLITPGTHINDEMKFFSRWLMDDAVVLEAAVGLRPWLSADCLDLCMRKVWGPDAINEDKKDEEGIFSAKQLIWGLHMDFNTQVASLPEPKCIKAQHLLALPALQYGTRRIPLKLVQEVRGSAQ